MTDTVQILLSEIISALSFALDATEGALPGHSLRCCLLGMRIGVAAGLGADDLASLYYALQLKDAGCSSNSARMSAMVGGGDDRALKNAFKLTDWTRPSRPDLRFVRVLWRASRPGDSPLARLRQLVDLALSPENNTKQMMVLRCERGATITEHLQLGPAVAEAVRSLDEHWDGSGYPEGKRGAEISQLSRICSIAQHLDAFAVAEGPNRAIRALGRRRNSWYDPKLIAVTRTLHQAHRLWEHCLPTDDVEETRQAVLALDPGGVAEVTGTRVDRICEAFAGIVDAKSPFTYRHSVGVMQVACAIADELGLPTAACDDIRRAALLHDVGKLTVSNAILDKPNDLTETEWASVRQHPLFSGEILRRVPTFEGVARLAEQHHERLNGTGYPLGLRGVDLCMESRVIAIADCYSAMAEDRPYRAGMSREQIFARLATEVPHKLDPLCFRALQKAAFSWPDAFPAQAGTPNGAVESPAGASDATPSAALAETMGIADEVLV